MVLFLFFNNLESFLGITIIINYIIYKASLVIFTNHINKITKPKLSIEINSFYSLLPAASISSC